MRKLLAFVIAAALTIAAVVPVTANGEELPYGGAAANCGPPGATISDLVPIGPNYPPGYWGQAVKYECAPGQLP